MVQKNWYWILSFFSLTVMCFSCTSIKHTKLPIHSPTRSILQAGKSKLCGYRLPSDSPHLIVYLHGGPGYNCFDFAWFTAPNLSEIGEVIAFDQRGCGCSPRGKSLADFSLEKQIEDVYRLIETESRGRPVVLMGHSYGGILAVHAALRWPKKIKALVLIDTPLDLGEASNRMLTECSIWHKKRGNIQAGLALHSAKQIESVSGRFSVLNQKAAPCIRGLLVPAGPERISEEKVQQLTQKEGGYSPEEAGNDGLLFSAVFQEADNGKLNFSTQQLQSLQMPVLVVNGELDPYFGKGWQPPVEKWKTEIIPQAGHHSYRDRPKLFSEKVKKFIEGIENQPKK